MKKLLVFNEGVAIMDSSSNTKIQISGKDPEEILEDTPENRRKYIDKLKKLKAKSRKSK